MDRDLLGLPILDGAALPLNPAIIPGEEAKAMQAILNGSAEYQAEASKETVSIRHWNWWLIGELALTALAAICLGWYLFTR